jgi:hypothetical protein
MGAAACSAIFQCSAFGGCTGREAVVLAGRAGAMLPHFKCCPVNTASPLRAERATQGNLPGVKIGEWTGGNWGVHPTPFLYKIENKGVAKWVPVNTRKERGDFCSDEGEVRPKMGIRRFAKMQRRSERAGLIVHDP